MNYKLFDKSKDFDMFCANRTARCLQNFVDFLLEFLMKIFLLIEVLPMMGNLFNRVFGKNLLLTINKKEIQ